MTKETEYDRVSNERFYVLWIVFAGLWGVTFMFIWTAPGSVASSLYAYWKPASLTDYALLGFLQVGSWAIPVFLASWYTAVSTESVIESLHTFEIRRELEEWFADKPGGKPMAHDSGYLAADRKDLGSVYGKCGCSVLTSGDCSRVRLCGKHAYGSLHTWIKRYGKSRSILVTCDHE